MFRVYASGTAAKSEKKAAVGACALSSERHYGDPFEPSLRLSQEGTRPIVVGVWFAFLKDYQFA